MTHRIELLAGKERINLTKFLRNKTYFDLTHGEFEMHRKFVLLNEKAELTYDENNSHGIVN